MSLRVPSHRPILTAQAMRDAEQACFDSGVSQSELMERAGSAVAREAVRFAIDRPILVLAGPGNNGGDAYVAAQLLKERGHDVIVAALGGEREGAAETMRRGWTGETVALADAVPRAFVIDGLFGTGMSRPLEGEAKAALHRLIDTADFTLAIDLPSGIDTDSGSDMGGAACNATVALGALKPAHMLGDGIDLCGQVLLADIGIATDSSISSLGRPRLSPPASDAHKYSRGMVVVVEGDMPGASRLAARAALHGGAGYVMLAGQGNADSGPDALVHKRVESAAGLAELLNDDRIGAVVIGPGLGRSDAARDRLEAVLGCACPAVFDGDALTMLDKDAAARFSAREAASVLTPHGGEFARMFDSGEAGKIAATRAASQASGATLIHKGRDTVIVHGNRVTIANAGTSWLSTAGSGDVLAGLAGARLAANGVDDVTTAVWLHGRASELAGPAFAADDLVRHVPTALGECL